MMWRDILLAAICLYLARQWYKRHFETFHGKRILERVETKDNGFAFIDHGFDRWSGVRRILGRSTESS